MILLPHILLLWYFLGRDFLAQAFVPLTGGSGAAYWMLSYLLRSLLLAAYFVVFLLLHLMPVSRSKERTGSSRLRIMQGGRKLLRLSSAGILIQAFSYLLAFCFSLLPGSTVPLPWLIADGILVFLYFYLLVLNGCIRILCTCRRLGIVKRTMIICFLFIPLIHLFLLHYLSRKAKEEYDQELCRFENRKERDGSLVCATKYPVILLHGIGFRDFKYFNYWGRIPKELVRNGAFVYYGHQNAWGTIEDNAAIIRETIEKVLALHSCEKVNIIAHSKGGLDARYLISGLHMEDKVASLTTMSTPHRGSELLNLLNRLPDCAYRFIASLFDKSFSRIGDTKPDCYHSSKQLSPEFCREFNEKFPDAASVYYQSYASIVKYTLSDGLLSIPNLLMYLAGASKNDGLVTVESAKWGIFRETFVSTGMRGISHGDMIDLKREDYKGFDVLEAYVKITSELKEMGF